MRREVGPVRMKQVTPAGIERAMMITLVSIVLALIVPGWPWVIFGLNAGIYLCLWILRLYLFAKV